MAPHVDKIFQLSNMLHLLHAQTCLGKDMAYFIMKAVASMLLLHFKVKLVPGHKVVPKISVTLYMKHGLLVTLEPRETTLRA